MQATMAKSPYRSVLVLIADSQVTPHGLLDVGQRFFSRLALRMTHGKGRNAGNDPAAFPLLKDNGISRFHSHYLLIP